MRTGMKWFIALLIISILVLMLGVPLWGLLTGPGFDP